MNVVRIKVAADRYYLQVVRADQSILRVAAHVYVLQDERPQVIDVVVVGALSLHVRGRREKKKLREGIERKGSSTLSMLLLVFRAIDLSLNALQTAFSKREEENDVKHTKRAKSIPYRILGVFFRLSQPRFRTIRPSR